jgi:hypothetical protein
MGQIGRPDEFTFAAADGRFVAAEDLGEIGQAAAREFGDLDSGVVPPLAFGYGLEETTHGLFHLGRILGYHRGILSNALACFPILRSLSGYSRANKPKPGS